MNIPTIIVLAVVAVALVLVIRYYVRSGRKITDCGCGSGSACKNCQLTSQCSSRRK